MMAEAEDPPSFGAELKDAFKPVNAWVANGISWLDDIQQFYRERSIIEKDYSTKLNALAKKYLEKKAKKLSTLSVGDTPTMTPGSLESASLTTWNTQLTTLESTAAEHDRFSTELVTYLADPIKYLGTRYEDIRRRYGDYAVKLEKERDASYADLRKMKGGYDSACQEVENRRKKADSAFDYSKQKAQNSYQQQTMNMHNVKNSYLISVNVTNKQKEKYYHEYVPELLDGLQDLSETKTAKMNTLWSLATQLEIGCLSRSTEHLNFLAAEIPRNAPQLDSIMFIRHNITNWQEPPDMSFEPSPVWHDDDSMIVDENAKIFLSNLMGKSKGQMMELRREVEKKRREVGSTKRIRQAIREGKDKKDEVEVVTAILSLQEELHRIDHKRLTAEIETSTIQSAVGDVTLGAKTHDFKSQTFKIPTNCDLCGERIWGLSAKGFDCRDCGYTCHSKCEMKVPATCPGEQNKEEKKKLKIERQEAARASISASNGGGSSDNVSEVQSLSRNDTMSSLSSGYAASAHRSVSGTGLRTPAEEPVTAALDRNEPPKPAPSKSAAIRKNRVVAPPPKQYVSELPADDIEPMASPLSPKGVEERGRMLYAYKASGEGEITVQDGRDVTILESDDGSGWIKVRAGALEGIVPATYVELLPSNATTTNDRPRSSYSNSSASVAGSVTTTGKKKGPAVAPRRGAKKVKYVEALYDYEARSNAEWGMTEGERFVLVNKDAGDGWADVEKGGVVKSVPANYIEEVT